MNTRFDLLSLKLFVAAAEEQSIAAAAGRASLVPSAVSKRLALMEEELGVLLLKRHTKGVSLTPAGETLLVRARDILRSLDATALELQEYTGEGDAHIRLSANHSSMVQYLPADLALFLAAHRRAKIDLVERLSADVVRSVGDGMADVGIYCWPMVPQGLEVFDYRQDELVLALPPDHPLAGEEAIAFAQAAGHELIAHFPSLTASTSMPGELLHGPARVRIHLANFEATCRMVEEGLGLAVLPRANVQRQVAQGRVAYVRLTDAWAHRQLQLCVRSESMARPLVAALVRHLAGCTAG